MRWPTFILIAAILPAVVSAQASERIANTSTVDYSQSDNWVNIPSAADSPIDVFYLYPTSWTPEPGSDAWYCDIDDASLRAGAPAVFDRQASAFMPAANVYAPFYRQADGEKTLELSFEEANEVLHRVPVQDVYAALDYYFEHYNPDRPFVLAGHSQGSQVLLSVLDEYMKDRPDLRERMAAAYVIGYSVTDSFLSANPEYGFAKGADDTGVIISWNTEAAPDGAANNPVVLEGANSINPLNWLRDGAYAGFDENLGSYVLENGTLVSYVPGIADAWVDEERGVILTNADKDKYGMPPVMGFTPESFHGQDYAFYYANIRENFIRRSAMFLSREQASMYPSAMRATLNSTRAFFRSLPFSPAGGSPCGMPERNVEVFATPFGSWSRQNARDGSDGYDVRGRGVNAGVRKNAGDFSYGAAIGYSRQTVEMKRLTARTDSDVFNSALFAGIRRDGFYVDALVGYTHAWHDADRSVMLPTVTPFASRTDFGQDVWSARLEAGYGIDFSPGWRLTPNVGFDFAHVRSRGFDESGSGYSNLRMERSRFNSLETPVGVRVDKRFDFSSGTIVTATAEAAWAPELGKRRPRMNGTFIDGVAADPFSATAATVSRSRARLAAGVHAEMRERVSLGIDYEFEASGSYRSHNLRASFGVKF